MTRTLRHLTAFRDRQLSADAADHIHKKLYGGALDQTPKEFVFCLPCDWMRDVFVALCSVHELVAYRDLGMRRDKVVTIAPAALIRDRLERELYSAIGDMHTAIVDLTNQYIVRHLPASSSAAAIRRSYKVSDKKILKNGGETGVHE